MYEDRFNELMDLISTLSDHQLNRLKSELLVCENSKKEKVLSDEEMLMLNQVFKED